MTTVDPDDDAALERLVAAGLDVVEAVPASAREAAYGAVGLVTVEAELAALVYDSRSAELALTRSEEAQARIVTFANDHLTVDLELLADGRTIVGELQPAEAATVELETVGQGRVTTVGRRVRAVPPRRPTPPRCASASWAAWSPPGSRANRESMRRRSEQTMPTPRSAPQRAAMSSASYSSGGRRRWRLISLRRRLPVQPLGHGGAAGAGAAAGWLRGPGGGVEPGRQALPRQLPVAPLRPGVGGARRHHRRPAGA